MPREAERVIIIGAGPVGLSLALVLAQQDIHVDLIEALGEHNFLEQVPRAGTNHPATLELLDRIGLYAKIEPRGIIAPLFHYWDRREQKLIAEFDHRHIKDDTRFPYVLQCERIKIVEEALKLAKAHPNIALRLETTFTSFSHDADGVTAAVKQTEGAIGYAELSFDKANSLGTVKVKNAGGSFVEPNATSVAAALAEATIPADLKVKINYTPTNPTAYAITTDTFVIVPQKPADPAKAKLLKSFILYALDAGQQSAVSLYYAPLPSSLASQAKTAAESIHA